MFRTFNCGIGMALIVAKNDADKIIRKLKTLKEKAFLIGEIEKRCGKENSVVII